MGMNFNDMSDERSTMDTTAPNAHEAEVDTKLAELWSARNDLIGRLNSAKVSIARNSGRPAEWGKGATRGSLVCSASLSEVLEMAQAVLDDPAREGRFCIGGTWTSKDEIREGLAKVVEIQAAIVAVDAEAAPLEAEYEAKGWSRFFLVMNGNGHIHSSMACSTCRITTLFSWLPTLSGLTEKDAVDAHGPLLCSVCFPSAPVEWRAPEKADDPNTCPGSGTYNLTDFRQTSYSGSGRGRCGACDQMTQVTSSGKLRKHKKAA